MAPRRASSKGQNLKDWLHEVEKESVSSPHAAEEADISELINWNLSFKSSEVEQAFFAQQWQKQMDQARLRHFGGMADPFLCAQIRKDLSIIFAFVLPTVVVYNIVRNNWTYLIIQTVFFMQVTSRHSSTK